MEDGGWMWGVGCLIFGVVWLVWVFGCLMLFVGCFFSGCVLRLEGMFQRMEDGGWMRDVGCWMLGVGCRMRDGGCWNQKRSTPIRDVLKDGDGGMEAEWASKPDGVFHAERAKIFRKEHREMG